MNYFSDKVIKNSSRIHGRGLFAIAAIAKGEIVVVKGGVVMSRARRDELEKTLGPFDVQIGDDLFIGPDTPQTLEAGMMNLNHSCDPNVVFEGQITFVAWRDIAAGEELTLDYATGDDDDWQMTCTCGAACCRGKISGQDWRNQKLQEKYDGHFAAYLQKRIEKDRS